MRVIKNKLLAKRKSQQGFVAFTSLIVISAVTLAIATSVALMGIDHAQGSLSISKNQETLAMTKSCAEEALIRLRNVASYSGGTLNMTAGSCIISISGTGGNKTIDITSNISGPPTYTKSVRLTVKRIDGSINIVSWQEL
ncbi:MAG: hypothetical protein OEX81_05785 [Candidatus Pacebacteria bacterium]|nr:hypothetical protein [Candidatus Paceibacterota bacterium]